jgi:hypothetical protein
VYSYKSGIGGYLCVIDRREVACMQLDLKYRPLVFFAGDMDLASMSFHYFVRYSKPQAGSVDLA